jgi:hypothetical protein
MWEAQPLETLRASTACTGITLPYLLFGYMEFNEEIMEVSEAKIWPERHKTSI